ncbi:MAG: AzlC family ABC transporter permease [Sneathiellales bacterium]|nr:AzlC family ABC transporter permease [Sneathiellales bacterium]
MLSILPLAIGAALYGFAFGILAAQTGFPWWAVTLMSSLVHAGSSQIVAVERFASDELLIGAALAGVALNLRYLGIAASLGPLLKDRPLFHKLIAVHLTGDENWALTFAKRAKDPSIGVPFLLGSGLVMISTWTLSTTAGAVFGTTVPDLARFGLGFAFTAAFIAMARALWRGHMDTLSWGSTFIVTLLLVKLTGNSAFSILAGSVFGISVSLFLQKRTSVS